MNKTFKTLMAILLAAIMVVGLLPTLAIAEAFVKPEDTPTIGGYIPVEKHGTSTVSDAYAKGDWSTYYSLTGYTRDLPSSYDSRNYNIVTSVKNQGSYGSCWAHAAMACVETYMIKNSVPVGTGSAATTSLNLSETQHCFFNYSTSYDAEGLLTGDKTTLTSSSSKNGLDCGGNGEMSSYTLMRWTGSASESVSALAYSSASSVANSGLSSTYAYNNNVSHVQNCIWVPSNDIEGIKNAIMTYGAGNISYCAGTSYSTYSNTYQCVTSSSASPNHAIQLIGWDDSISKSNFKPNTPSGNGGWLCKNSWGTSYFNQGYMYISYEDASVISSGYIFFYDAEPIDNYDHNYQYDGTCNVATYGKGYNSSTEWYEGFANNTKVANVFTAKGTEMLRAISFCNWDEALTYTVDIYKNPTTGNPSSGTRVSGANGYLTYSGYYTIQLDTPVLLNAGDTFSVVITQSCPTADDNGKYIHTPYDASFNNSNYADWVYWTHANHGNTSYYQEPNGAWTDCPDNGDYRIKAYTDDYEVTYTVTATVNNAMYGTVSVLGTVITATPANGYYVESCTLVSGTATWTISGNTISVAPTSDCTIRVNFAPKPTYTVNYIASGVAEGSVTAYVNDVITLPNSVSVNPDEWTFIGWVAMQVAETETQPTYYAPGASYTVTGNATLYALYTRTEGGGGEVVYQLTDHLEDGGRYIIIDDDTISGTTGKACGNTTVSNYSYYFAPVTVTVNSDDTVTATTANLPKVVWVASGNDANGYTFYNEAVGKYMGLNSSEILYPATTGITWKYTSSSKELQNDVDSEGYYWLSYSEATTGWNSKPERYTTSSAANAISLYAETQSGTTYYTTDPVVTPQPVYYTVTFKDWDGTVLSTQQVLEGEGAVAPANPTRVGYTFTGWDVAFDNVTSDLVVTAQYTINTYTVTFVDWDGTVLKTQTVAYGGAATAPANPTRVGYTFTGWDVAFNYITGNLTVTAQYTINTYTVTFVDWDGTVIDTQTVAYGGAATAPADPTREGYTFIGWDVAFNYITGNLTVTAQYEEDVPPVTILLGDVNCDGLVNMADVALASSYVQNSGSVTEQGILNGDINGDGVLTASDLAGLLALALN